jgi:hypothetical protein
MSVVASSSALQSVPLSPSCSQADGFADVEANRLMTVIRQNNTIRTINTRLNGRKKRENLKK